MAEEQNPQGQPQKQFDNENAKEAVNLGNQLKQTYAEAAKRAADMGYAFKDSVAAATRLQSTLKDTRIGKNLTVAFKDIETESKNIEKRFKNYAGLVKNAAKSSKGLAGVLSEIDNLTNDIAVLDKAREASLKQVEQQEQRVAQFRAVVSKQENKIEVIKNHLKAAGNDLSIANNKLAVEGQKIAAATNKLLVIQNKLKDPKLTEENRKKLEESALEQDNIVAKAEEQIVAQEKATEQATKRLGGLSKQLNAQTQSLQNSQDQLAEEEKILDAAKQFTEALTDSVANAEALRDEFTEIANQAKDLNGSTKFFNTIADVADNDIVKSMGLGFLTAPFREAAEASREMHLNIKEAGHSTDTLAAKMDIAAAGFAKLASIGITAALSTAIVLLGQTQNKLAQIGMQLNVNKSEAVAVEAAYLAGARATGQMYTSTLDMINAQTELNKLLGTSAAISVEAGRNFSYLTERLGVGAESASKIAKFTMATVSKYYFVIC